MTPDAANTVPPPPNLPPPASPRSLAGCQRSAYAVPATPSHFRAFYLLPQVVSNSPLVDPFQVSSPLDLPQLHVARLWEKIPTSARAPTVRVPLGSL